MSKLKPLPRSKAKTAYGLISDVIRAIEAEPKRIDMNTFGSARLPQHGGPACGTVGCFAGWVNVLAGGSRRLIIKWDFNAETARNTLGRGLDYRLANGGHVFDAGHDISGEPGTVAYAEQVVDRIRRFQRVNAARLRAKKLSFRARS